MKSKIWVDLARLFEWVFGTILMVALGAIAILPLLSGRSRLTILVGLIIYLVASLIRFIDDRKKCTKS